MNKNFREAALYGEIETLSNFLSEQPQLVNETDEFGFTALHEAVGEDSLEVIEMLISGGANVNAQNDEGIAPLHLAAYDDIAEALIEAGADIEIKDHNSNTPLLIQAEDPEGFEVMALLLQKGANINAKNKDGNTALDVVKERSEEDKISLLHEYKKHKV